MVGSEFIRFVQAPTRYESVGCDDGNFSFPKEYDEVANSLSLDYEVG